MNDLVKSKGLPELKPCPFCGGRASLEQVQGGGDGYFGGWSVGCDDGGGGSECLGYQSLTTFSRQIEAITAWNTRANECTCKGATEIGVTISGDINEPTTKMDCQGETPRAVKADGGT